MEAKNMEWHALHEANGGQLRHTAKCLVDQLEVMKNVQKKNSILQTKINSYKLNEKENDDTKSFKKEILELRKQLKIRKEMCEVWKDEREHFLKLEVQLGAKDRDLLRQLPYKEECLQLRKNNRDLKVAMSKQEQQLMGKTHVLKLEVEKLQEKTSKLQRKNEELQENKNKLQETSKDHKHAVAQKQRALVTEERCSELEKQLERALKELHIKMPPNKRTKSCLDKPFDVAVLYDKHIELVGKLIAERKHLELKDNVIKEMEKQNKERLVSRPLPFELNPESQRVSREQGQKVRSLVAQVKMLYLKAEEDKREREKLVDELVAMKKKYLSGKMQNTDLRKALRRRGAKQEPEENSSAVPVPPRSTGLHRQSGEKEVTMQTAEPIRLPPLADKSKQPNASIQNVLKVYDAGCS